MQGFSKTLSYYIEFNPITGRKEYVIPATYAAFASLKDARAYAGKGGFTLRRRPIQRSEKRF